MTARAGLLAHEVYSQVDLHAAYGGVVPELASRDHLRKLLPLLRKVLDEAGGSERHRGRRLHQRARPRRRAAGRGGGGPQPGLCLAGALHRRAPHGGAPARAAARARAAGVPVRRAAGLGRPHAARAGRGRRALRDPRAARSTTRRARPSTRPPSCSASAIRAARSSRRSPSAVGPDVFRFPRPLTERPGLDFSFSGLKTAVVVALRGRELDDQARADAARAFEEAVVETLVIKCRRALEATDARTLVVAGGVGANRRLRARMLRHGRARRACGSSTRASSSAPTTRR